MIDFLVLSTRFVSRTLGPWVTIFCIQSKGWPFVLGAWALWDLLLLQGNSKFDYHWLYWTGIRIYAEGNSGSYIISSETYLRILLAAVLIAVMTTLKRTMSTLYFGRRMFGRLNFRGILYSHNFSSETNQTYSIPRFEHQTHTNRDWKRSSMT
jgi:hypothetical protein